jgi:hypothetical protein
MAIGNYAAINWFIVGCFVFFFCNGKQPRQILKQNSVFTLLILSLPLNYVVILTNPLVVAYYSFMSIGELEMGFTDAELCK